MQKYQDTNTKNSNRKNINVQNKDVCILFFFILLRLYFGIFAFYSICILFHLYFIGFVFCYICILAICMLSLFFLLTITQFVSLNHDKVILLYFVMFVFCIFCILSYFYFVSFVFCSVCIIDYLHFVTDSKIQTQQNTKGRLYQGFVRRSELLLRVLDYKIQ